MDELPLRCESFRSFHDDSHAVGACGGVVGCEFDSRLGYFSFLMDLIVPAALGPGVRSASDRNEYRKQKNYVSGEQSSAGA
jgi:hypothetical protein